MPTDEITCAFSGLVPVEADLSDDDGDDSDIPAGWVRVTITRREPNPRRVMIAALKAALVERTLGEVPAKQRADAEESIALQIDAQFAALESITPAWLVAEEVAYIAPPARDKQIEAEYQKLRATLGLDPAETKS